jgi:hypothetical protein
MRETFVILRILFGACVLMGLTIMGCTMLTTSLWSIPVAMGGIFAIVVWIGLVMGWEFRD